MSILNKIANICHENNGAELYGKLAELTKEIALKLQGWIEDLPPDSLKAIEEEWLSDADSPNLEEYQYNFFIENIYKPE